MNTDLDRAAQRGLPSYLWRFGQERRLNLITRYAPLAGQTVLDVGCGIGTYLLRMREFTPHLFGIDLERGQLLQGKASGLANLACARAEALPFPDASFGLVLLHEVLEHVDDDRLTLNEARRLTRSGGKIVIFAPNRFFPFETHGIFWRGKYRFGNFPLVGFLPDSLRRRLTPHVRAYTSRDLRNLLEGLEVRIITHTQIFPGYDHIASRFPMVAKMLRGITYFLEKTPLRILGLSHFLVLEKLPKDRTIC
ncbi:MAG: class I SAM-dependent methyltransferase [Chloroflexi bacterium]|nr:class I SAM-dependent methyltransferase [Chloroflexota bacterium]